MQNNNYSFDIHTTFTINVKQTTTQKFQHLNTAQQLFFYFAGNAAAAVATSGGSSAAAAAAGQSAAAAAVAVSVDCGSPGTFAQ